MRSINQLIQHMNKEGADPNIKRQYDAYKQLDDNIIELQNKIKNLEKKNMRYFCRAYSEQVYAIPAGGAQVIPLEKTEYPQYGNMHSNATENTKIWFRRNGVYHMSAGLWFTASAGGTLRTITIRATGSRGVLSLCTVGMAPSATNGVNLATIACTYYMYKGDYIELTVTQDTAGNLNTVISYPRSPFLSAAERPEDLDPSEYGLLTPEANMR